MLKCTTFFTIFSKKALPLHKILSPMGAIDIVSASAGSGKTYNMAYRYIRTLITNPYLYRHILAVTFTNKATDELKERILKQLNSLATGKNEDFESGDGTEGYQETYFYFVIALVAVLVYDLIYYKNKA